MGSKKQTARARPASGMNSSRSRFVAILNGGPLPLGGAVRRRGRRDFALCFGALADSDFVAGPPPSPPSRPSGAAGEAGIGLHHLCRKAKGQKQKSLAPEGL